MIWERKGRQAKSGDLEEGNVAVEERILSSNGDAVVMLDTPKAAELDNPVFQNEQLPALLPPNYQSQTALGRSVVLHGELAGDEDFLIEGQFEGNIKLKDSCLIVGHYGRVRAEIEAREVLVFGRVDGSITARDKIHLRKTSQVVGNLTSAAVIMEEGAYVKGSIEVLREQAPAQAEWPSAGAGSALGKTAASS